MKECYNEVAQEDDDRQGIVQYILRKNTDFLKRIIVPVEGQGGVGSLLSCVCPHCHRFPLEDFIWCVSSGRGKKQCNWCCAACGGQYNCKAPNGVMVAQDSTDTPTSLGPMTPCATCPLPCTRDDGDGDDHPVTRKRVEVQGTTTTCIDTGIQQGLLQMHESEGSWGAHTRLVALDAVEVDRTWLWRPQSRPWTRIGVDSVRLRLGSAGPHYTCTLHCLPTGSLDSGAAHATWCALGDATRGHNAVTSLIHAAPQSCDHTAETEVPGLIPGTDPRPAGVLASALGDANRVSCRIRPFFHWQAE